MSHTFEIVDSLTHATLQASKKHHVHGGTYCPDGVTALEMDMTYNYGEIIAAKFKEVAQEMNLYGVGENGGFISFLNNKPAKATIPVLEGIANKLKDDVDPDDYWNPTEGNCKVAILNLVALAMLDETGFGVWEIY